MAIPANQSFVTRVLSLVESSLGAGDQFDAFRQSVLGYMNSSSATRGSLVALRKKMLALGKLTFKAPGLREAYDELLEVEYEEAVNKLDD